VGALGVAVPAGDVLPDPKKSNLWQSMMAPLRRRWRKSHRWRMRHGRRWKLRALIGFTLLLALLLFFLSLRYFMAIPAAE